MNNDAFTDVSYKGVPDIDECIYNAVQVGKLIDEPPSTVRVWANMYYDYLYIKKINGRLSYTQESIEELKFIKDLIRNKGFTHEMVKNQINKFGFNKDSEDSDSSQMLNAVTSALAIKNQEQMKEFMAALIKYQEEFKVSLKEELKNEVSLIIDEQLDTKLNEMKEYFDSKEDEFIKNDEKKIEMLREHMQEIKDNTKKSLWGRLFRGRE